MFGRMFRRETESQRIAAGLYGAIVAQARQPALYDGHGVADTVDGRFEMVVLHTILVLDRLQGDPAAQAVFDLFCVDMDRSLREMGIGDLGVPKRMKTMTERFYGRAAVYREALASRDTIALANVLARNVYGRETPAAVGLAAYALAAHEALSMNPPDALRMASIALPDPAVFTGVSA